VEKQSISCYVKTSRNYYIVTNATCVVAYVFLSFLKFGIILDKSLIIFTERLRHYFSITLFFCWTQKLFFFGTLKCIILIKVLHWFFYFFELIYFINLRIKLYLQILMDYRLIKTVLINPKTFILLVLRLIKFFLHENCC
jgi:hypothetical protein